MCAPTPLCPRIKLGDLNVPFEALPMFPSSPINPPTAPAGVSVTPEQAPWLFSPVLRNCNPDVRMQLKCPPTQTESVVPHLCSGDLLSSSGLDSLGLWPLFHESRGPQEQPRC